MKLFNIIIILTDFILGFILVYVLFSFFNKSVLPTSSYCLGIGNLDSSSKLMQNGEYSIKKFPNIIIYITCSFINIFKLVFVP